MSSVDCRINRSPRYFSVYDVVIGDFPTVMKSFVWINAWRFIINQLFWFGVMIKWNYFYATKISGIQTFDITCWRFNSLVIHHEFLTIQGLSIHTLYNFQSLLLKGGVLQNNSRFIIKFLIYYRIFWRKKSTF